MPEFSVEFEVYCSCGEGLCSQSEGKLTRSGPTVIVHPCEKCIEKTR